MQIDRILYSLKNISHLNLMKLVLLYSLSDFGKFNTRMTALDLIISIYNIFNADLICFWYPVSGRANIQKQPT